MRRLAVCLSAALSLLMLSLYETAHADAIVSLSLTPGDPVSIEYTGPAGADWTTTFSAGPQLALYPSVLYDLIVTTKSNFFGLNLDGGVSDAPGPGCCSFEQRVDGEAVGIDDDITSDITVVAQASLLDCQNQAPGLATCDEFFPSQIEESFNVTITVDVRGVDASALSVVTPLPATLPMFFAGLGALCLLGWRRKQKAQAAA